MHFYVFSLLLLLLLPFQTQEACKSDYVGDRHVCIPFNSGLIKCWGFGWEGSLGTGNQETIGDEPNEMGNRLPFVALGSNSIITDIVLGGFSTHVILLGGFVKCWGYNYDGTCGYGHKLAIGDNMGEVGPQLPVVNLGAGVRVSHMSAGDGHTCAVLMSDLHDTKRKKREAKSKGEEYEDPLDGKLKCWGANYYGQLGLGDLANRGDDPNEMGDFLPFVDVGTNRLVRDVAAGNSHTCVILQGFDVKCWGYNLNGQLGDGDTFEFGYLPEHMGDYRPIVDLGAGLRPMRIIAGAHNNCVITLEGKVFCWGYNKHAGMLGVGSEDNIGNAEGEMGENLTETDVGTNRHVIDMDAGLFHMCAILDDYSLKCWGRSDQGQTGLPTIYNLGDSPNEMGDKLPPVELGKGRTAVAVSCGEYFTCVILDNHDVKCFGYGRHGQLGNGMQANIGSSPVHMEDRLRPVDLGVVDDLLVCEPSERVKVEA